MLHLVHWNTNYASFTEARDKINGLAVLGVMLKLGVKHSDFSVLSDNLDGLVVRRPSPAPSTLSTSCQVSRRQEYQAISYTPEDEVKLKNNGHSIEWQITQPGCLHCSTCTGEQTTPADRSVRLTGSSSQPSFTSSTGTLSMDKSGGLAVLGIMIKSGEEHPFFFVVSDNLGALIKPGSMNTIPSFLDPTDLLPDNIDDYWTYEGSITTVPFYKSVQWIVFKEPEEFSLDQLNALWSLIDSHGNPMEDNFRPPQPIKGRISGSCPVVDQDNRTVTDIHRIRTGGVTHEFRTNRKLTYEDRTSNGLYIDGGGLHDTGGGNDNLLLNSKDLVEVRL
ncbi:hypothetical protein DPMN_131666 [Dreissena polymorpha]|uniref:carbonic anhydrase n=1 Tax=Dreissena polymorpha TaxID=45954 RepID=A0A9D4J864_DREPO|nr:hypothetical protein DPMN_131666 [Dreissena polymorpha]